MCHRDELIISHLSLAERIAASKKKKVPRSVHFEDLQAAAYMGLVDAAGKYDKSLNNSFEHYAHPRISGAIQDYLRECGWGPKNRRTSAISIDAPQADGQCMANKIENRVEKTPCDIFEKMTKRISSVARDAMRMYYVEDMTMKDIGVRLGLTESRVSQIVKQGKTEVQEVWGLRQDELWQEVA
jgi:RNA polymerase sigma factor (sigma-70 family)